MENRQISEIESLKIITEMIKNARVNLRAKINCNILLLWGYTTVIISFLVWGLKIINLFAWSSLVWLAIPLICLPMTFFFNSQDKTQINSYIDKSIYYIVLLFVIVCTITAFLTIVIYLPILFLEQLLINMMIIIIGILIQYKPIVIGGIGGVLAAHLLLFIPDMVTQIPFFASIFIFSLIIPGHLFKKHILSHV